MTAAPDPTTRRLIAIIIGVIGVVVLIDVLVIALARPDTEFDGVRQLLIVIVGALLVLGGALTFSWPEKGRVTSNGGSGEPEGSAPSPAPSE